jgi:TetR/AcrR family transcriptional repressor of lmrAB and yxaGH operons
MVEKGRRTRERMIEVAAELLERSGYHGLSLGELVSHAGAPRGSLYHHFPGGKDELVGEALEVSAIAITTALRALTAGAPSAGAAVGGAIDLLAARMEEARFEKGCPIAATALDASSVSRGIARQCAHAYERWTDVLAARIAADGVEVEEAHDLALFALAAIEGGLLLARARRSRAPLDAVKARLVAMLDRAR